MEDGPDIGSSTVTSPPPQSPRNNGHIEMANFPTTPNASPNKVNGEAQDEKSPHENDDSGSDGDNLVIDETPTLRASKKKTGEQPLPLPPPYAHSNPYFAKSIFELTNHYNTAQVDGIPKLSLKKVGNRYAKRVRGKNGKPPLRDYTHYLGLQPSVQFKCSKCGSAGFESLQLLNEHHVKCTAVAVVPPTAPSPPLDSNSTNFKVTRKVFLCSACGTYYENWNLFLHMREVHKRFICLYCLGMFPQAEKLSTHLVAKHNCAPTRHADERAFFSKHQEACFLMCCDCQKVFNEQDNFTFHQCTDDDAGGGGGDGVVNNEVRILTNQLVIETSASQDGQLSVTGTMTPDQEVPPEQDAPLNESLPMLGRGSESDHCDLDETIAQCADPVENDVEEDGNLREHHDDDDEEEGDRTPNNDSADAQNSSSARSHCDDERKVPRVTLKLKLPAYRPDYEEYASDASDKRETSIVDKSYETQPDDEAHHQEVVEHADDVDVDVDVVMSESDEKHTVPTAGVDVLINEIDLDQPLDKFDIKLLLQKCLRATVPNCLYCNHARKIAVNGKQLGLHAIGEHRYSSIVRSITAEELIPESFNARIAECLDALDAMYFSLEEVRPEEALLAFECFQCRYSSPAHKELYQHNRKMHAKALVLCIMCKSCFYSYSELLCHLCPGVYSSGRDVQFRCCLCVDGDVPSAFRLMVHLRKTHDVCDVCLERCQTQARLSNHVWKHKLHHLCYRCGIAYRNKPDITKHLFWKHGTESVVCKRCMQKKWPHVYHFCSPAAHFACDECALTFRAAANLKVHKRLHAHSFPHACAEEGCAERFISKKLAAKHAARHRMPAIEAPPPPSEAKTENALAQEELVPVPPQQVAAADEKVDEVPDAPDAAAKPKVDVYDLPALNLSESDSDSEADQESEPPLPPVLVKTACDLILETSQDDIVKLTDEHVGNAAPTDDAVLEIWDNFKNYQANITKAVLSDVGNDATEELPPILSDIPRAVTLEEALRDHDYCPRTVDTLNEQEGIPDAGSGADHDYCTATQQTSLPGRVAHPTLPAKSESSASSDSDSSSCTCGSNCSCSSSSAGSSSSSSDSSESDSSSEEGRRRQQARREKRRGRKPKHAQQQQPPAPPQVLLDVVVGNDEAPPIRESDLETTESDTDEEFYDKEPQKLANILLAEKREKLMQLAALGPYINGAMLDSRPTTPSLPEAAAGKSGKKKSKSKKKKRKKSAKRAAKANRVALTVAPLTLSLLPKACVTPMNNHVESAHNPALAPMMPLPPQTAAATTCDSGTRASKRRRVPNKFYGYSSEEDERAKAVAAAAAALATPPSIKFRKVDLPSGKPAALTVPPITIKTTPAVDPIAIRLTSMAGELRVQPLRLPLPKRRAPAKTKKKTRAKRAPAQRRSLPTVPTGDSDTDSNSSTSDVDVRQRTGPRLNAPPLTNANQQPALYCYCRCPYDEVSEMIGCDSQDCHIEWFHFECVGIMVPPKGHWFCPECRKRKQERIDMLKAQVNIN